MGERVTVRSLPGNLVESTNGTSSVVLDLPREDGGEGTKMGPHETLLTALGACTVMTLRLYARRKGWPLEGVEVAVAREKATPGVPGSRDTVSVDLRFFGPLDAEQSARLLEIARKCPVYRTLTGSPAVVERLAP